MTITYETLKSIKLNVLTLDNPKTQKQSLQMGYIAASLPLAPHKVASDKTLCPSAEKADCYTHCLFWTGHGGLSKAVQNSRIRKTKLFTEKRKLFMSLLISDINVLDAYAEEYGLKLAVRLNAFTDINWTGVYHYGETVFSMFPRVQFYDYTKVPKDPEKLPANYRLTFSYSPQLAYQPLVKKAIKYDMNMTVVFNSKQLPEYWDGKLVIDGDKHDLRFLDPHGVIVGLREKRVTEKTRYADKRKGLSVKV